MPTHIATGGITFSGKAIACLSKRIALRYSVGDLLFTAHKARKGIIEKIAVKKIILNKYNDPIYVDTFNAYYFQEDLLTHEEALALATAYQELKLGRLDAYVQSQT